MIAQRDEEIEEHSPAPLHLRLHGPALLERATSPHNECKEMRAEAAVAIRRMRVCITHASQNRADVDADLQALLAKGEALQVREGVPPSGTVDGSVAKDQGVMGGVVDERRLLGLLLATREVFSGLDGRGESVLWERALEIPASILGLEYTRAVISFIEVFELWWRQWLFLPKVGGRRAYDAREDFRIFR